MSMKFLIVSDTHGRMYNLEEAMEREEFDGMIHCGDVEGMDDLIKSKVNGPCYMVMGNNDWFSNLPAEIQVNIDDYRAFITHGHNYGVSLGLEGIYAEALSRVWISYCSAIRTGRSQKSVEISGLSIQAASRIRVRWEENQAMPC